jgi:RNA polymerase primary sigma factor
VVRLPLNRVGTLNRISRAYSALEQKFQREPSPGEVAEELDVSQEEIESTMRIAGKHVSVNAPLIQGEESSLLDVLANSEDTPDSGMMVKSLQMEVSRALSTLTEREAEVISSYFGLNGVRSMSLEEIGDKFNLTRERVRQIKEKATRRLRHTSRSKSLKSYLG